MTEPKIPMAWAAQVLSAICEEIDGADQIDAFLLQAFDDANQDLSDAADRRIAFDRWVKIQKAAAEEGKNYYTERENLLKTVHERFKARTKEILEARPGLPYSGKLGKISIAGNGGVRSLELSFGNKAIDPESAAMFGVPADYVLTKYVIDTDRIRAELEAGVTLEWAWLAERGTHVNFPRAKKEKVAILPEAAEK